MVFSGLSMVASVAVLQAVAFQVARDVQAIHDRSIAQALDPPERAAAVEP